MSPLEHSAWDSYFLDWGKLPPGFTRCHGTDGWLTSQTLVGCGETDGNDKRARRERGVKPRVFDKLQELLIQVRAVRSFSITSGASGWAAAGVNQFIFHFSFHFSLAEKRICVSIYGAAMVSNE